MLFVNSSCENEEMKSSASELIRSEMTRVLQLEGEAILACVARLKSKPEPGVAIESAVEHLRRALEQGGKIIVTGVGKSGKVGQKIAATLSSTGSLSLFLHPTEGLHGDLGVVTSRDAVIALSYTGNTEELVRLLPSIKRRGVPVVGIGGNPRSRLALQCDVWVDASVEQEACPHNLAPTSSTTLALALGDAFAMTLMQLRGFDAEAFAKNHPGGSLGRRLHMTVGEIMHQGDALARVAADASMDDVVILSTQKRLGAVLVVEGQKLLGVITDGDIRRALRHREKFFLMKASEVMSANPVVTSPQMLAQQALELMENRPRQIAILPVVDAQGQCLGLVRIHDLVQLF